MSRFLLDTHALIWWWMDDPILRPHVRSTLTDEGNEVFVSAASGWEIATKVRKGQLPELRGRVATFRDHLTQDHFKLLPISVEHGVRGGSLQGEHKDPFDRIIAAQGLMENLTVVTRDRAITAFGCETLW